MQHRVQDSPCGGRILKGLAKLLLVGMLSGCAQMPQLADPSQDQDALGQLDFFAQVLAANAQQRERLWQDTQNNPAGPDQALRVALLRSLPGHAGSDPAAAQRLLAMLSQEHYPPHVSLIARIRLNEVNDESQGAQQCRQEVDELRQRLDAVVDIEREIDSNNEDRH